MYQSYCKHRISEKCCVVVNMLNLCSVLYIICIKNSVPSPRLILNDFMTSYVNRLIFKHRIR